MLQRRASKFNRRNPSHVLQSFSYRSSLRRGGFVQRTWGSRIDAAPTLDAAGALCAVSAVLCAVGLSAFAFERRARESRVRSSVPDLGTDALLAGGSSFFQQHIALTLIAALFGGVLLGGEY